MDGGRAVGRASAGGPFFFGCVGRREGTVLTATALEEGEGGEEGGEGGRDGGREGRRGPEGMWW